MPDTKKLETTDEQIVAAVVNYAPDGEPERTNEELIKHLADHLATNLGILVEVCGIGKCVLHNKSFTLKIELSPSGVVVEDFLKEHAKEETK